MANYTINKIKFGDDTFKIESLENIKDGSTTGSLRGVDTINENANYSLGQDAVALGKNTEAAGDYSYAEGFHGIAGGMGSHVQGLSWNPNNPQSFVYLTLTGAANATTYTYSGTLAALFNVNKYIKINNEIFQITAINTTNKTITLNKTLNSQQALSSKSVQTYVISTAYGDASHAQGMSTLASGMNSHAEGAGAVASGATSHAEGVNTIASGNFSHVEGYNAIASGATSHAEGSAAIASGSNSHAEGASTIASNNSSHAEGASTTSSGDSSHAEGASTIASGNGSHAEGIYDSTFTINLTGAANSTTYTGSFGYHNYVFQEGRYFLNGNNNIIYKIVSVIKNQFGSITSITLDKTLNSTSALNNTSTVILPIGQAQGEGSHAEGCASAALGDNSHAEGYTTYALGDNSHAEGECTIASSLRDHAEGGYTTASGGNSHAQGNETKATEFCSHAEGEHTIASGEASHAQGNQTKAQSQYSHAEGYSSQASHIAAHAGGYSTQAKGIYSTSIGERTIANNRDQLVFGKFNNPDTLRQYDSQTGDFPFGDYVEIVGNGTGENARSNARTLDWNGNEKLAGSLTLGAGTANEVTVTAVQLTALLSLASAEGVSF